MKTWHKWTHQHSMQVQNLLRDSPGLSAALISNRLGLPHGVSTVCAQLTHLNHAGKVHRERTGEHHEYVYYPPINKPNGKVEPQHKVAPPKVKVYEPVTTTADVLIVVPVGSNKTATLTLVEARRVYEQLAALFKN